LTKRSIRIHLGTFAAILLSTYSLVAQQYTIKFATLATEGSTWINVMNEYDQAIRKESGGRVGFKIYANGVQGDEKDVLRKIRLGQLHGAGITGVGIGEIAKDVRILDAPFLFKSSDEVDSVSNQFHELFEKSFEDGGFVLLGWAEVGFVYIFTNSQVTTPAELKGVRMWMWEGDPIAEALFSVVGVHPIPLSITDVMTSLQTKLIDGIYSPPFECIALQWFTRVKYMLDVPLADAQGAIVVSKSKFDQFPKDIQDILLNNGKTYFTKLTRMSREDNTKAVETLKKNGIQMTSVTDKDLLAQYDEIGRKARRMLIGKLYDEKLLNDAEAAVQVVRSKSATKKSK
jgi:TRAP-type C4-dicarboxylate transport system substrate-binding protein